MNEAILTAADLAGEQVAQPGRRGWNEADVRIRTPLRTKAGKSAAGRKLAAPKGSAGVVPVFFATDDNYLPFLAVTLESIRENSSREYDYRIYVLHSGVRSEYEEKILRYSEEGFEVSFVDVTERLKTISSLLHMRDYYTCTTYFRIFIAGMFPQYDKAIYLDCDTVVLGDLSALYDPDDAGLDLSGAVLESVRMLGPEEALCRIREINGRETEADFSAGVARWEETDWFGENGRPLPVREGRVRLTLRPCEIKTVRRR